MEGEIPHLLSKKYQVTRNTAATVEVTTISPKYGIFARTYCHTARNMAAALEFTALHPEYKSTVEFTAIQLEIRHLWSKLLLTRIHVYCRIHCHTARNMPSADEFTALQARNTAAALEFSPLAARNTAAALEYCLITRNMTAALE
ncbi:hypothetical protein CQ056_12705 [Peribacillus simplex]|nr:hypothetical protein CQ056_12705 [Peribacillus simplex]